MHDWEYLGKYNVEGSLMKGCNHFRCKKCGFEQVSYTGHVADALASLIRNQRFLVKCHDYKTEQERRNATHQSNPAS